MRFIFSALPLSALLLASCANEGTVVRKDSNPMPFYHSLGVDGSYKLALRDNAGAVHSQLVTPEVYSDYAEGDYFNDTQPPLSSGAASEDTKDLGAMTPVLPPTLAAGHLRNGNRVAGKASTSNRRTVVAQSHPSSAVHAIAHAQTPALPAPVTPKIESPVVTAHFSVAVQNPAPVAPVSTVVAAKIPAPVHPVATSTQKSFIAASEPKPATNLTATAPGSRRSYHVASKATAASSPNRTPVTTALVSAHPASSTKSAASKKAVHHNTAHSKKSGAAIEAAH